MHERMARLQTGGAHQYIPRQDQDYAFGVGLRMLVQRHLVVEDGGLYSMANDAQELIAYYANAIVHLAPAATPRSPGPAGFATQVEASTSMAGRAASLGTVLPGKSTG
jgi:hypothetical protein